MLPRRPQVGQEKLRNEGIWLETTKKEGYVRGITADLRPEVWGKGVALPRG